MAGEAISGLLIVLLHFSQALLEALLPLHLAQQLLVLPQTSRNQSAPEAVDVCINLAREAPRGGAQLLLLSQMFKNLVT